MPGKRRAILLQYGGNKSQSWGEFNAGILQGIPAFPVSLSLEGDSQMVYILPERLLALVRPAFDLVLRRIRSLKRCVQACGCKIETPRYACNLAPGCISSDVKLCQRKPLFPFFSGTPFFGTPCFLFFVFS